MMVMDLARVRRGRYVTPRRRELQGLRYLPMGALLLLIARIGTHPAVARAHGLIDPSTLAGHAIGLALDAVLLFTVPWLVDRWYDHTYGPPPQVGPGHPLARRDPDILTFFLAASFTIQNLAHLPAPIFLLAIAAVLSAWWPPEEGLRCHYRWLCCLLGPVAVLGAVPGAPLYQALRAGADFPGSTASYVALGLIACIGGVLDHRLIAGTLHPLPKEHHDAAV